MVQILFKSHSGEEQWVDGETGSSLMQAAVSNGVAGIDADCGGSCSCATCHVILNETWDGTLEEPSVQEADMLSFAVDPTPYSRLACQVQLTDQHEGLTLAVAKRQY